MLHESNWQGSPHAVSTEHIGVSYRRWSAQIDADPRPFTVELTMPQAPSGWVILTRPAPGRCLADAPFDQVMRGMHQVGLATLVVDLPRLSIARNAGMVTLGGAAEQLRIATLWLQAQPEGRDLPINYFGAGVGGAVALRAATPSINTVIAWNGRTELAWRQLRAVSAPTLLIVGGRARPFRRIMNRLALRRLNAQSNLLFANSAGTSVDSAIYAWLRQERRALPLVQSASRQRTSARLTRRLTTGAVALSLSLPLAVAPVAAHPVSDPFAGGQVIRAADVRGDGVAHPHRRTGAGKRKAPRQRHDGSFVLGAHNVQGDGVVPQATGSKVLSDSAGLKYFVNTNITFSTTSSASGAMSEASFVGPAAASTLNGGTVQSTLNDAFDGYNSIYVDVNGKGKVSYNKNGVPATTDCLGQATGVDREIVLPTKTISGTTTTVDVTRRVFIPENDTFARWSNIFTNTGSVAATVVMTTGNNLGSDSNTRIFGSSNITATAEISDTWVGTFQNFSGTTSSDPRLAHILQGPGARAPLSAIKFVNGDDNPFWSYTFTLAPGQVGIILDFVTGQPTKAAAAAKAQELVGLPSNALQCMSVADFGKVLNFAVPADLSIDATLAPAPIVVGSTLAYTLTVNNAGPADAQNVVVTNTLPLSSTFLSAIGSGWTCNEVGGVVTCTRPTLAVGAAPPIQITVTAPATAGQITSSAGVTSSSADPNTGNNTDSVAAEVIKHKVYLPLVQL